MAYQADILINVKGFQDLARIQKALDGTAYKIDEINKKAAQLGEPVKNIAKFTQQLEQASRALNKVAIGSPQETKAVANYVTALNNSNNARTRQNKLIQDEINKRNAAINAIRATVEANIAESQATRRARDEAAALNKELVERARLERKLSERGLMPLAGGKVGKGVADAGFGPQGPALPPKVKPGGLQAPGVMDAILGGAFPALFGAGPGAMLGGAAGGFIGGKMGGIGGMALSIAFSAIGQQIDEAIKRVKELGDAINMVDVDKLRESFVFVNSELEVAITRSIRLGDIEGARAQALAAAAQQTGALGTAIQDSANATALLGNSWTKVSGTVASLLSMVAAPFISALAGILEIVNLVAVGWNKIFSIAGQVTKAVGEFVVQLFGGEQALQAIQNYFMGLNEEQQKANAAAQLKLDLLNEEVTISNAILNLEKQRTQGITAEQKLQNIDIDLRQKKLNLIEDMWNAERRVREENKGASEEIIQQLVEQEQKKIQNKIITEEIAAARQKEVVINQELIAQDKHRIELLNIQASVAAAREKAAQTILSTEIQRLEQQREFALSLNQEAALIDQISARRIEAANLIYEATVREQNLKVLLAELELQSVEAAYERGFATEREVEKTQALYNASIQVRDSTISAAQAVKNTNIATEQLAQRKQKVAAYAAEYARQTKEAVGNLKQQANAVKLQNDLVQARASAQQTINNLELEHLNAKLQQAKSEGERYDIIYKIRDLEIANARITLEATQAQIRATVEQQRIALDITALKYEEMRAVVKLAEAQGVVTRAHYEALEASLRANKIAHDNYKVSQQIAYEQDRAAVATYNAAVNAAKLKVELSGGADEAARFADEMQRGARAAENLKNQAYGYNLEFGEAGKNVEFMRAFDQALKDINARTYSVTGAQNAYNRVLERFLDLAEQYNRIKAKQSREQSKEEFASVIGYSPFAKGGYVTGPTRALIGEGGESEYVIPSSKMDSAMANYASGRRGSAVLSPQVNITTGPVTQMDGTNYVTMNDLQQATSTAARQGANLALSQLQNNPSVRRAVGVAR